jgi:hypothetical protein
MNPTISRDQLEHEARAKIFWGDEAEAVVKFLRMNGVSYEEAESIVDSFVGERLAALRGSGVRKIIFGALMVAVPVIAYVIFISMGFIPLKTFACTVVVGLWGAWKVLKGGLMFVFPESETVDLADDTD